MSDLYETVREPQMTQESLKLALQSESGLSKVWVVVEGKGDVAVFSRLFSSSTISVKQGVDDKGNGGYTNVENIVNYINSDTPEANVFGIRDKDYTLYQTPPRVFPDNVFLTDRRDLEMMLSESPSVRDAFASIVDFDRAERKVMPVLRYLGYQRIYIGCRNMLCAFEDVVKVSKVWDYSTHDLLADWKRNCDDGLQAKMSVTQDQLFQFIEEKRLEQESDYDVCRGHDYIGYVSRALINTAKYSENYISSTMYDSYSLQDFLGTNLCASILAWQNERGVIVVPSNIVSNSLNS